jgi:flagellar biosynthesis regulator FlbT
MMMMYMMLLEQVHLTVEMIHIDVVNNDDDNLMFDLHYMLLVILFHEKELPHNDIKRIDHPKKDNKKNIYQENHVKSYIMSPYTRTLYMIKFS